MGETITARPTREPAALRAQPSQPTSGPAAQNGLKRVSIKISDWRNEKWEKVGSKLCGRTSPPSIDTTTNRFKVLFKTNPSVTSDGFKLSWSKKCGGVVDLSVVETGTIISPNYPKPYQPNLVCNYTLLAPGEVIHGVFEDFNIEEALAGGGPPDPPFIGEYSIPQTTSPGLTPQTEAKSRHEGQSHTLPPLRRANEVQTVTSAFRNKYSTLP
ncbi:hypothetical protein J6590_068228 [Homalodisca vitripennis]|nr:hypothetical protein J6590_068228 [Homalodisca vitripennis]